MSDKINPQDSSRQPVSDPRGSIEDTSGALRDYSAYATELLKTSWNDEKDRDTDYTNLDGLIWDGMWDEQNVSFGGSVIHKDEEEQARSPSPLESDGDNDIDASASTVTVNTHEKHPVVEKTQGLFGRFFGWITGASSTKKPEETPPLEEDWTDMTGEPNRESHIDWSGQGLSSIGPERFSALRAADPETLDLSDNKISNLDEDFADLTKLKTLDLSRNPLIYVDGLQKGTSLQTLILNKTILRQFPWFLKNLKELKHLELEQVGQFLGSGSRYREISRYTFPQELSNLEILNMCFHMRSWDRALLPKLDNLINLKHLNIVGNDTPPVSWDKLKKLETVTLDSGQYKIYSKLIQEAIPSCKIIVKDIMATHRV
ncbi:MAG: leucine-rich repeat domain-containing protein [Rhabdochlamydiaceae bacterium]|jgi:hypothetical protein